MAGDSMRNPASGHATLSRIGIIGCGAVTEKKYLPALRGARELTVTAIADLDEARARRVADAFGIPVVTSTATDLGAHADIAVVAVPHHLHAAVAVDAMKAGLHVFVEKPLATHMRDVQLLLDASVRYGRKIGVGLVRRQYASFHFVKAVLAADWIGAVRSFDFREGGIYNWPVATMATFRKDTAGGVLYDTGAHTLDLLLAWLGPFADVRYCDDSRGGVEANCRLDLSLVSGVRGVVELSRTRALRNTFIISGERGEIEIGAGPHGPVTLRVGGVELSAAPRQLDGVEDLSPLDLMRLQVEQFAHAVQSGGDCPLFAEHTIEPIRLFDACKSRVEPMDLPWEVYEGADTLPDVTGRRILVLGGTGFIGGRLVEVLTRHTGARVRVLSRDLSRLSNICRYDVDVVPGDVTDGAALRKAMDGCDVVVNCTFGRGSRETATLVNVEAVNTILTQAAQANVRRVVHLSTVSAYGVPADGELTEDSAHKAESSFVYGHTKWQGEQVGFETAKRLNLDFRVLQPTVVYGPGAPSWTHNPLRMLKSGQVVLVNGGTGACNAVYVDDVVQGIICAVASVNGAGERFLISGPAPSTWREFYGVYERLLGYASTTPMSLDDLLAKRHAADRRARTLPQLVSIFKDPALMKRIAALPIVQSVKGRMSRPAIERVKGVVMGASRAGARGEGNQEKPVHISAELDARFQASTARVSVAKAMRLIGFRPRYDLNRGMARTAEWVTWANLLD